MTPLSHLERVALSELAMLIEAGYYADDRRADTVTARAASWLVRHAAGILFVSIIAGALLLYGVIMWCVLQPW